MRRRRSNIGESASSLGKDHRLFVDEARAALEVQQGPRRG